ncbi:pyridoxamine 5'-phosphate oxidase family protein [Cupriavidus sp. WKF15]|uniref:pyridoxamine 5'-phosphate oxidase family protein n=1 Tax=Cupriavidus sp. WKF15 TaxID=3032282 RepID=UPI0023E30BBB|nr:pyridoxamine 5'-phosphate oxidase family protein [Cupriavidus sp. WKF15]WER47870.1 pyridoxamine 5'-phosphate oxidase family protein [Cupriavidus sp. WKF15]
MELPERPDRDSPFHAGELAAQERAGVRERMDAAGWRMIRAEMPEQHRTFFGQLPFLVAGAVDDSGLPWATLLTGEPGFAYSPDPGHLRVDALPTAGDPLQPWLKEGRRIGLLGIELPTRRRNRMNGTIAMRDDGGITVAVEQSFGNCPRYIQLRQLDHARSSEPSAVAWQGSELDTAAMALLRSADTLFVASHYKAKQGEVSGDGEGVDVSHRGGKPGFIRVDDARTLTFPDFSGNNLFNTIGNLLVNARAGIVVPDFCNGSLLHLSGEAEVIWDGAEVRAFAGAERLVRVHVASVVCREHALPWRGQLHEYSPWLADTGSWAEGWRGA